MLQRGQQGGRWPEEKYSLSPSRDSQGLTSLTDFRVTDSHSVQCSVSNPVFRKINLLNIL